MKKRVSFLFDYGNVLCLPQNESLIDKMSSSFALERERFLELYWEKRQEYDRGDFSAKTYWTEIAAKAGKNLNPSDCSLLEQWDAESWSFPNPSMHEILKKLRISGYPVSILSNIPQSVEKHLSEMIPFRELCDHFIGSWKIRSAKPETRIYLHALQLLQSSPEEVIFFDDRQENIHAAKNLGIQAHLFKNHDDVVSQLKEFIS